MKEYLKVQLPAIALFGMSIALILLLVWLDGYRNGFVISYGLLLVGLLAI